MLDIQKTCKRRESLESIEDKHLRFEKNKINRADLKSAVQQQEDKAKTSRPEVCKTRRSKQSYKDPQATLSPTFGVGWCRRSKQSYKDTKPHLDPSLGVVGV